MNVLTEKKIKLAKFMDAEVDESFTDALTYRFPEGKAPTPHSSYIWTAESMEYDSSWSWLMSVIDKIDTIQYACVYFSKTYLGKHKVEISLETPGYREIQFSKTVFIEANTRIEATFEACVQFIDWYNENMKK